MIYIPFYSDTLLSKEMGPGPGWGVGGAALGVGGGGSVFNMMKNNKYVRQMYEIAKSQVVQHV